VSRPVSVHSLMLALALLLPTTASAQTQPPVHGYLNDSSLALLRPLIGLWRPLVVYNPSAIAPGKTLVAEDYRWTVGGRAIHYRENYPLPEADSALVDGMIYLNPATERVEFLAISGAGAAGHLYVGEYHQLEDGTLERVFEAFYRAPADVPGDAYGGLRRRYRQRFQLFSADSVGFTLEWFHDGAWRPFGGRFSHNTLMRLRP
jgi:hypothetical protein